MGVLAAVLAALAVTGATAVTPGPGLRVAAKDPLAIAGLRFGARESVRVEVRAGAKRSVRTVVAGADGGFRVAFPGFRLDRATDLDVTAVGARGHRASFQLRHPVGGDERV